MAGASIPFSCPSSRSGGRRGLNLRKCVADDVWKKGAGEPLRLLPQARAPRPSAQASACLQGIMESLRVRFSRTQM